MRGTTARAADCCRASTSFILACPIVGASLPTHALFQNLAANGLAGADRNGGFRTEPLQNGETRRPGRSATSSSSAGRP